MGTSDNRERTTRTAVRMTAKLKQRLLTVRERESAKIGIEQTEAAIVRRAIELGLAQMEKRP